MKVILLVFIFPAIIFAGNFSISFKNHYGKFFYTVKSNNFQNLKSKLEFPFNFDTINLEYKYKIKYFNTTVNKSILLNNKIKIGKDFDWKGDKLTVYSTSDCTVEKYYNTSIKIDKDLNKYINNIFIKFNYKVLNMNWKNTYQEDYIKKSKKYINDNSLKFEQNFYEYSLGLNYSNNISNNLKFEITPSIINEYIKTKDIHLLRNFYTIQHINTIAYNIKLRVNYIFIKKSNFIISFDYKKLKNKTTNMNYYNILNEKYTSFPSSYMYQESIFGIYYKYTFN